MLSGVKHPALAIQRRIDLLASALRYAQEQKTDNFVLLLNYCADITLISYLRQLLTGIVPSLNAPEP